MANKFIVKTTEEFVYDNEGRVVKKITTEESYEVEQSSVTTEDFIKKALGVPNTGTSTNPPWTTTTVSNAKADTSGITHTTINVNANPPTEKELQDTVKKALDNIANLGLETHPNTEGDR
jgi:hypothetical protein